MKRISIVLCAVACAASACGGSKPSLQLTVASSADKTAAAKTAKVQVKSTIEGDSSVTNVVEGVVDFTNHLSSMNLKVNGLSITAVSDGTAVYEKLPAEAGLPQGKPWVKLTFADLGKLSGIEGADSLVKGQNDPSATLSYLRGAGEVTKVGTETVRGEKTTHYHAVVSYEQAAAHGPASQAEALRSIAKVLGTPTQPLDVWLDADGRVRRQSEKIDLSQAKLSTANAALPKTVSTVAEFYDFGTSVNVTIPPANEVSNFSDVFGDAAKGSTDGKGSGTPTSATDALEPKLISTVLAGYKLEPDSVGDTGPSDLDKAVRDDGDADARAALTSAGFVAGYQRLWTKGDNEIVDFVYEFKSNTGAESYRARTDKAATSDKSMTVTAFAVAGVPGAKGYSATDGKNTSAIVLFTRGGYAVQMDLNGTDATPANATQLAKAQYDKL